MRTLLSVLLLSLTSTASHAAGAPWFNDQGDCQRHWADTFNGCVSRRDSDNEELSSIDLRITQAESARDAAVKPKQDAAELYARLDEKQHESQDVFLPFLARTVGLCRELRELLIDSAAPAVASARALVEMASISEDGNRPQLTPEVAAGLTATTTDSLALSVILDSTLPRDDSRESDTKTVLNVHTTDVGAILERLETSLDDIDRLNQQLAGTLGKLTAENELMLESEKQTLASLETELSGARTNVDQTESNYTKSLSLVQALKDRKSALPGMISGEATDMGEAAQKRDTGCAQFWFQFTTPHGDHDSGHGGHFGG